MKAGSAVVFNCTLDETCVNQSVFWYHYSASDTKLALWYKRQRYSPTVESRGVTVNEDTSRGWSVLSIPRARLEDGGRFHCYVAAPNHCQMNFQLTVTGNLHSAVQISRCLALCIGIRW